MANSQPSYFMQLLRMVGKIIVGGLTIVFMISFAGALLNPQAIDGDIEQDRFVTLLGDPDSGNVLLRINVSGLILGVPPFVDPGPFNFFSGNLAVTYGYAVKEALKKASENEDVKGVLIHMATPGGTVFGSKAVAEGIASYRETTGKPVVVYIEGLSASGGVMSMVTADAVYADEGSYIGSIGVLGAAVVFYDQPTAFDGGFLQGGVTTQGGIEQTIIYAGRSKDLGNPFRRLTDEERVVLQTGVNDLYQDFVQHVAEARDIEPDLIVDTMGAQIFSNAQAERYGLIDGTRSYDGAISELAALAELGDDWRLARERAPSTSNWARLFMSAFDMTDEPRDVSESLRGDVCTAARLQALLYMGNPAELCAIP